MSIEVKRATKSDSRFILKLIKDLAVFEKAADKVVITLEDLERDGFEDSLFESIIIFKDNIKIGMALFYNRYSTWQGKSLYLEDLYIIPEYRGFGAGMYALKWLAMYAVRTNCNRFEWQVLDWNKAAIQLYEKIGSQLDPEWINCRLERDEIKGFSESNF